MKTIHEYHDLHKKLQATLDESIVLANAIFQYWSRFGTALQQSREYTESEYLIKDTDELCRWMTGADHLRRLVALSRVASEHGTNRKIYEAVKSCILDRNNHEVQFYGICCLFCFEDFFKIDYLFRRALAKVALVSEDVTFKSMAYQKILEFCHPDIARRYMYATSSESFIYDIIFDKGFMEITATMSD